MKSNIISLLYTDNEIPKQLSLLSLVGFHRAIYRAIHRAIISLVGCEKENLTGQGCGSCLFWDLDSRDIFVFSVQFFKDFKLLEIFTYNAQILLSIFNRLSKPSKKTLSANF